MSQLVKLIIDGQDYEAEQDSLLIQLLIDKEIKVPYFCYHESLGADGNCRMCMVGIEGQKRPQIACDTLIKEGMIVNTKTDTIKQVHTDILELELINHPVDCPTCDQAGECSLQDFYMEYGLHSSKITIEEKVKHNKAIDLGSNVMLDQERCVLCARCTRFTDKITGTHELGIVGRGDEAKVTTMPNRPLSNPYAMNVVDLCPVGALTSKDFRFSQRVWLLESADGVCHGCAKNCSIIIDHNKLKYKDDTIYRFRPRRNDAINGFFICDTGRLSYRELQENRQETPLLDGVKISEDKAIEKAKELILLYKRNTSIIIDANLYTQEIEAIVAFAQEIGADVYAPLDIYRDEAFGDDMLRSSMRAANAQTIINMDINTQKPKKVGLILNFNHPEKFESAATINFLTHTRAETALTLPIATFTESSGSLTNEDGITQFSKKVIHKNIPVPTLIESLKRVSQ